MPESPARTEGMYGRARRFLTRDLPNHELIRMMSLSLILCCLVGTYWLLRSSKDALFMKITGKAYIPYAKMASFAFIIPLILLYSKLVEQLGEGRQHYVFYFLGGIYGSLLLCISAALRAPLVGLQNTTPSPYRLLGWVIYLGIESFGSLSVPAFWAFTNCQSRAEDAKKGYGLIIFGAQFGAIAGPTLARYAKQLGLPSLMGFGGFVTLVALPLLTRSYVTRFPPSTSQEREERKQTGIMEGLRLLLTYKYLMGIMGVATFYEVIGTILDYQMKFQLDSHFSSAAEVAEFMGGFGQCANGLAFIFSFVGTGFVISRFGLTCCLAAFPASVGLVCLYVGVYPSVHVLFWAMVVIKGLSYALNSPCKEILYLQTSKDCKQKTKGWIDMFGGRAAKGAGSMINAQLTTAAAQALYAAPINLLLVAFWGAVAYKTGVECERLQKKGDEARERNEPVILLGEEVREEGVI